MYRTATAPRPASPKQTAFIARLVEEKSITDIERNVIMDTLPQMSTREASAAIDLLMSKPRKSTVAPAAEQVSVEGMHKVGDRIFKVQRAVHGSGNLYAKELVERGPQNWGFDYAPGAIRQLSAKTLMTLDEAKAFGALYGTCCVCGRTLTDEGSIAAGIGPVCAGKF